MYKAIVEFYDLTDGSYKYSVGDVFPHAGFNVSEERIAFLLGNENRLGKPVIEKIGKAVKTVEKTVEAAEPVKETGLTKEEVEKMQYFSLRSLALKNGISPEGKTAELKAKIIEKLNL